MGGLVLIVKILNSFLNVKALVGSFNQEKALVDCENNTKVRLKLYLELAGEHGGELRGVDGQQVAVQLPGPQHEGVPAPQLRVRVHVRHAWQLGTWQLVPWQLGTWQLGPDTCHVCCCHQQSRHKARQSGHHCSGHVCKHEYKLQIL